MSTCVMGGLMGGLLLMRGNECDERLVTTCHDER